MLEKKLCTVCCILDVAQRKTDEENVLVEGYNRRRRDCVSWREPLSETAICRGLSHVPTGLVQRAWGPVSGLTFHSQTKQNTLILYKLFLQQSMKFLKLSFVNYLKNRSMKFKNCLPFYGGSFCYFILFNPAIILD